MCAAKFDEFRRHLTKTKISEMCPFSEAPDKYFKHFVGSVILISYSSGPTPTYAVASHSGGANEVRTIFGGT